MSFAFCFVFKGHLPIARGFKWKEQLPKMQATLSGVGQFEKEGNLILPG